MEYRQISKHISNYPEINAAYFFGSYVSGKYTPMSDIDIALLLNDRIEVNRIYSIIFHLSSKIFEIYSITADIKILNNITDLPFLFDVLSSGHLIYERDKYMHCLFVEKTLQSYQDFKPLYEIALKNYSRKLKNGSAKYNS